MQRVTLVLMVAFVAVVLSEGQYYVPRSYYTIDATGHESLPVPLRRLRRSYNPNPHPNHGWGGSGANANANANANARGWGGAGATANANANANAGGYGGNGGWSVPGSYGSSNPALGVGQTRRQYGPVQGNSVTASTSVGVDSTGLGYYDQSASVSN